MNIKSILNELAQIEYSSSGNKTNLTSNAFEDSIIKTIEKAFSLSTKLSKMFDVQDEVYDIEVKKIGSTIEITMNPEHGERKTVGTYPMMYVGKYINKPQEMASFLLMNYQS